MLGVLKLLRYLRHIARAILPAPLLSLLRQILGQIEWVNFFKLFPVLLAIVLAPGHFFRRRPSLQDSERSFYEGLVPYVLHTSVFSATIVLASYSRLLNINKIRFFVAGYLPVKFLQDFLAMDVTRIYLYLAVFCVLSPLWMIPLSLVVLGMHRFVNSAWENAGVRDASDPPRPRGRHTILLLPALREVYRTLRWENFFEGLAYFAVSAFLLLQLAGIAFVVSFHFLRQFLAQSPKGMFYPAVILVPYVLIPALATETLVVRPYIELLLASCRIPVKQAHESDVEAAADSFSLLLMKVAAVNEHKVFWEEQATRGRFQVGYDGVVQRAMERISDECAKLMPEIGRLRKIVKAQNRRYRAENSEAKETLVQGRLAVYSRALPIVELEDLLGTTQLPSAQQESTNAVKHAVRLLISEAAVL